MVFQYPIKGTPREYLDLCFHNILLTFRTSCFLELSEDAEREGWIAMGKPAFLVKAQSHNSTMLVYSFGNSWSFE